jgi:phage gpG-like protein
VSQPFEIKISSNAAETLGALGRFAPAMQQQIAKALNLENELSIGAMQVNKLSQRSPTTLGVVSNRLRSSLRKSAAIVSESTVESALGTNVAYAGVHEYGIDRTVQVKSFSRKNPRGNQSAVNVAEVSLGSGRIRRRKSIVQTASGVSFVKPHSRRMRMPERSFIRSTISERAPNYSAAVSTAIVAAWGEGSGGKT